MGLVRVPAGRFQMGGGKARSWPSNEPVHEVVLTRPFYVSRTEVTRAQLAALSDPANAAVDGADLPAGGVTFDEAAGFCERLSARTGRRARLPTEAEWEWACRGGTDTAIAYVPGRRADHAWFRPNAGGAPHPVGTKAANGFGLHDMYGNVAEWCADRFGDYVAGRATDPTGPPKGDLCVVRGGSYADGKLLSSDRDAARPDTRRPTLGFRVVIEID
jgi:formylglycine-generating enzyme required for sulfatase activity